MNAKQQRATEALNHLRNILKPGDTVFCVLNNVSRSGMSREITLYAIGEDKNPMYLSGYAEALGLGRRGKREGNIVGGCGMDMGFHLVSQLSQELYPDGFECIGEKCPAADHFNGDRNYAPHQHSKYQGAYAIKHRWM